MSSDGSNRLKGMTKVVAAITTSVDGYIAGPNDGPDKGLGEGGERLHYWVFGARWTYDNEPEGEPTGEDAEWLAEASSRVGAIVGGRATYEAARHWGDKNPFGVPFFILTHRPEEEPESGEFRFVSGVEAVLKRAREAAGDKDVNVMGGADVIRQALEAGLVDELTIIIAPVVLGGGKRLFEGFSQSLDLEHLGVRQSPFATFVDYKVTRS
jgi:dihydrofolate reductase